MQYIILVGIIFAFSVQLKIMLCSHEFDRGQRIRREVKDFEEFLRHRLVKEPDSKSYFGQAVSDEDDYAKDNKPAGPEFGTLIEDMANNHHNDNENVQVSGEETPPSKFWNLEKQVAEAADDEKHHRVEEILFIRRSDSELNNPIAEVVEKLVNESPAEDSNHDVHQTALDVDERDPSAARGTSSTEEACPTENLSSNRHQTCSDGPEYEMKFHPTFSETIKQDMERMLPDQQQSKCDYRRSLGPETGVEDRAMCPFKWIIGDRNPSRIPEYLYEAKCSCQASRKMRKGTKERINCTEVKRVIPVLFLDDCSGGKKKYKQGWEEIAVACAPVEERENKAIDIDPLD